jgi:hypothetical protein
MTEFKGSLIAIVGVVIVGVIFYAEKAILLTCGSIACARLETRTRSNCAPLRVAAFSENFLIARFWPVPVVLAFRA